MTDLLAARSQMAISLGFHIIFACIGMVMPFFMSRSYYKFIKTGDEDYLKLTKMWMKGVAIFFAVGAVSGTLLSFELGMLWPNFMEKAGPIFGMPFSYEGAAFFLEAIALGLFLYGFDRLPQKIHWLSSLLVGVAGVFSGIFIVSANAWMNAPSGFDFDPVTKTYSNIDPIAAMFNDAWFTQALHMTLAAFSATSIAVLGIHAYLILKNKNPTFNRKALSVVLPFFVFSSLLQPLSGDLSAKDIAVRQPEKLAAMEAHFMTEKGAPLILGGIPDEKNETVYWALKIPYALSFLAFADFNAEVKGLSDFPQEDRPPVMVTHFAFQIMVGIGSLLGLLSFIFLIKYFRKKELYSPFLLKILVLFTPLGFLAVEAGWTVTEVGRQPWIIYKVMRTSEALTPMPGIQYSLYFYILMYLFMSFVVGWLFSRQIKRYQGEV
ncbi:MAG: cytochrome ubiquinol oxidase subunit I [Halobacteriovoraceae bacterium]|nr:cytochrome ubiquinol oxidase subunit I [Halobacteriovoraceae bacterium]|tara:strand:+ start:20709 stop:22013 length:1305 start_codon:yes stop_codon:yes gene_type:complete